MVELLDHGSVGEEVGEVRVDLGHSAYVLVERESSMVTLEAAEAGEGASLLLPPSEARQVANALLEAADECEGRRP